MFVKGDVNMKTENIYLNDLLLIYDLIIIETTCYQLQNPNCINHFLTNRKDLFKHCQTFETGLSDHRKLISTIMKSGRFKGPPKKKNYRSN